MNSLNWSPNLFIIILFRKINIKKSLYEEHNLLRRRVEINEERLHELRATNTYLLHQNDQLRRQTQCSCSNTINPVTLTTTSQPQQPTVSWDAYFAGAKIGLPPPHTHTNTCLMYLLRLFIFSIEQQVLSAVSIAPVQMQATPIVSIASIAAAQPTQIIASTPMAIATQSTQGQQIALASTQPPTQILGTSQITLAPGNCYIANLVQT